MKLKIAISLFILTVLISLDGFTQNTDSHNINLEIPEVAILGVVADSPTDITINTNVPTEAGNAVDFSNATNSAIWINYSSIISPTTPKRKVIAMVQGVIPEGLKLMVKASEFLGSGGGNLGKPAGEVVLSNQPSDVIVDIGSCYTGTGANNGHFLTYRLEKSDSYAALNQQNTSVNIVYTLTDYN